MKFGARIAAFARAHVGASAHGGDLAKYREAVEHKADVGTAWARTYYETIAPSTCALFACECLAEAEDDATEDGVPVVKDDVLEAHYHVGQAVADSENVAAAHRALEFYPPGTHPTEPFAEGDIPIVDGPPWGVHEIVVTSDAVPVAGGRWHTDTAQGGQSDGGIAAIACEWEVRRDGSMYPSATSARRVVFVIRAGKFEYDTPTDGAARAPGDGGVTAEEQPTVRELGKAGRA